MADRPPLAGLSDPELEQRLIDLGPWLYPTTPDLATQVRHRLESEPVRSSLPSPTGPLAPRCGRGPRTASGSPFSPLRGEKGGG